MPDVSTDLHPTVEQQLRAARQRYTRGRRELVGLLADAGRPLTIPEIIDAGADLSQSSVYRNLQILEQVGVVRRILTPSHDGARYELAEGLTDHHHHLVCTSCGTVSDFSPSSSVEDALETATVEATSRGFNADHHRLDLVGVCQDCT
jgi:Fur family transcriptional regulator, ferric uptake regulator